MNSCLFECFDNSWNQWALLLENISEALWYLWRFYLYTREIRRNLNTNLQVPGICWSQISLLKRSKMLNSKRRCHFSIARAANLGGSCSKMPGVNTASVNQLSRWNPCFRQKHHLKLPQRSVLCAGKVKKFARYTRLKKYINSSW